MKTINTLLFLTILMISISCKENKPSQIDDKPAVPVTLNTPSTGLSSFISVSGTIEAVQNANLSTRIMGYVNKIHVNVGAKVHKGQLLISINSTDIKAQLAQVNASITAANSAYKNAEKDFKRFTALYNDASASQKEMDDYTSRYEMAKAHLEAATQQKNQITAQLSYANITAPFDGIITGKFTNKGAMANPGQPLISIESPENFQVVAMVPESEITRIQTGNYVDIKIKSTNELVKGKVTELSTSAQNTGGQFLAKVLLEKNSATILSGMFVSVYFPKKEIESSTSRVLIPTSAIITKGALNGIYTVSEQDTAILRWLQLGKIYGDKIEVLSGLTSDENYVVSAEGKLYNGARLTIQQ